MQEELVQGEEMDVWHSGIVGIVNGCEFEIARFSDTLVRF